VNAGPGEYGELLAEAREVGRRAREFFGPEVHLFVPSIKRYETSEIEVGPSTEFVPVSVTGSGCRLGCDHCKGKLLERMHPATTPGDLWSLALRLSSRGCGGLLISGGADARGRVPLAPFAPTMGRIREELGLKVVVHTGVVTPALARGLAEANVECAMLDVIGDEQTARSVLHLDGGTAAVERSLDLLADSGVRTVPHVVVGLMRGRIAGEPGAIEMVARRGCAAVVLVVLTPLRGTPMQDVDPPATGDVAGILVAARAALPRTPLCLGCARPPGPYRARTDAWALEAGFNGIAFPADGTAGRARRMGLSATFARECCSLVVDRVRRSRGGEESSGAQTTP
jgi:hypothetical protein